MSSKHLLQLAFSLCVAGLPVRADYVTAVLNNDPTYFSCIQSNSPPGAPCYNGPTSGNASVSNTFANGTASAYADYGVNKVYVNGTGGSLSAATEWSLGYTLSGIAPGQSVQLQMEIGYDANVVAGYPAEAGLRIVLNNNTYFPWDIANNTDGLGDHCFDRAYGISCAGMHNGTINTSVQAFNGLNSLTLNVGASLYGPGLVDAYNTVLINKIIVPNGVTWQYNNVGGNPLHFQYAPSAGVPEPGEIPMLAAAAVLLFAGNRLRLRAR